MWGLSALDELHTRAKVPEVDWVLGSEPLEWPGTGISGPCRICLTKSRGLCSLSDPPVGALTQPFYLRATLREKGPHRDLLACSLLVPLPHLS